MKKQQGVFVFALAGALLLSGCSTDSTADYSVPSQEAQPRVADGVDGVEEFDESGGFEGEDATESLAGEDLTQEREIIVTGRLDLVYDDPVEGLETAADIVDDSGGFVESRHQSSRSDHLRASLTARIPAEKLDATVDELKDFADVEEYSTSKEDVTQQSADLDARVSALETSIERLEELLRDAKSNDDLFQAEEALTQRQGELDSLRSQREQLSDQVDYSTLEISITTEVEPRSSAPDGFLDGIKNGWNSLLGTLLGLVTAAGTLIPWLIILIPLGAVLWLLARRVRSRRRVKQAKPGKDDVVEVDQ